MNQALSIYSNISTYKKVYNELKTYCKISFNIDMSSNEIDYLYNYDKLVNYCGIPHFSALDIIKLAYEMDCKQY